MEPTKETYTHFSQAYDYFNKILFNDKLSSCIITMNRKKGANGFFWGDTWCQTQGDTVTDEIALNPDGFKNRSDKEVLSTLVHEMTHLEQHHYGKPSRNGYHNKEWSNLMKAIGLIPSSTGQEGGKMTGQKITHYIQEGGIFDSACEKLLLNGFSVPWQSITQDAETAAKKKKSKTKYTCMSCNTNAWAKPDTKLICGECKEMMISEEE